jgi:hypothetical protein
VLTPREPLDHSATKPGELFKNATLQYFVAPLARYSGTRVSTIFDILDFTALHYLKQFFGNHKRSTLALGCLRLRSCGRRFRRQKDSSVQALSRCGAEIKPHTMDNRIDVAHLLFYSTHSRSYGYTRLDSFSTSSKRS